VTPAVTAETTPTLNFDLPPPGSFKSGGFGNIDDDGDDDMDNVHGGYDFGDQDDGDSAAAPSLTYDQVFANSGPASAGQGPVVSHASSVLSLAGLAAGQERDEYSYLDPAHLRQWAGPRHWRTMTASATAAAAAVAADAAGTTDAKKTKRAPKARFMVDFTKLVSLPTVFAKSLRAFF
jgi:hypothetical protein